MLCALSLCHFPINQEIKVHTVALTSVSPPPILSLSLSVLFASLNSLAGKRLVALDVASVVAGSTYRGEFEERLQGLLHDCEAAAGSVVLFIDEIHVLGEHDTGSQPQAFRFGH